MNLDSSVYLEDDICLIDVPARSRLISLEPIGIGMPESEGLISYINRLAWAHCVNPRSLIREEFVPQFHRAKAIRHAEFYSDYARTIHGVGDYAAKFVEVTEKLTMRGDLRWLTSLSWQEIIPAIGSGFMASHPKWCKSCLLEHYQNGSRAYRRLSWGYELYDVCVRHGEILSDQCPWCNQYQPFFSHTPDMSRCAFCLGWLGERVSTQILCETSESQLWIARAIENMIEYADTASNIVTATSFRDILSRLVNQLADGEKTKFSEMLGMHRSTMASWITKNQKPLFPQFLYLCRQLDVMPIQLFNKLPELIAKRFSHQLQRKFHHIEPRMRLDVSARLAVHDRLKSIIRDNSDCRPLTEVADELRVTRKFLIYWFYELSIQISRRHRHKVSIASKEKRSMDLQRVRNIVWSLYSKGHYPSNRKVALLMNPLKLSLRREHLRSQQRKVVRELLPDVSRR